MTEQVYNAKATDRARLKSWPDLRAWIYRQGCGGSGPGGKEGGTFRGIAASPMKQNRNTPFSRSGHLACAMTQDPRLLYSGSEAYADARDITAA